MSKTAAILISIFVAAFIGVVIFLSVQNDPDTTDLGSYDASRIIPGDDNNGNIGDHVLGSRDADVFLVEYFDFSCPMCAQVNTILADYVEEKAGTVAVISRNFPIQKIHPNSIAAASAAEAAGLIKKPASLLENEQIKAQLAAGLIDDSYYFEMTDALFKNSNLWASANANVRTSVFTDLFRRIAPEADLDEFLSHMSSDAVKAKINFDLNLGRLQGVSGTPAFFIGGDKINIKNMSEINSVLKPAIEDKLKK